MPGQVKTIINVKHENRDRVTVLFRGILVFPMFIYLGSLMQAWHWGISSVVLTVPVILTLVFRGTYPSYILKIGRAHV